MSDFRPVPGADPAGSVHPSATPDPAAASASAARVSLTKGDPGGAGSPLDEAPFEGCLVRAVRMPVRIVTLLLIVPVRIVWDALTVCGRVLRRTLWVPFARATGWVWRRILAPVLFALLVWPWPALWRYVLAPVGRALAWIARCVGAGIGWLERGIGAGLAGLAWLGRLIFVVPAGLLHRYALAPVGRALAWIALVIGAGLAWLWRCLVAAPCGLLYRWVLRPMGRGLAVVAREFADAVLHAWRVAGHVSRAVFRFIGRVLRFLFADPAVWLWRHVIRPFGRGLRNAVWRPAAQAVREAGRSVRAAVAAARASVREARAQLRWALFGGTGARKSVPQRRTPPESGRVP